MPVCEICQADGLVCVNSKWFCINHVEEAFLFLGRLTATALDWDEQETEDQLREWWNQ